MPNELDHLGDVLAGVKQIKDKLPAQTRPADSSERKHLSLLDHIALLLVTKSKGDVAAVMMDHTREGVTFFYSKNSPCSNDFKEYLNRLNFIIVNNPGPYRMAETIVKESLKSCREKFSDRVRKCQDELKTLQKLTLTPDEDGGEKFLSGAVAMWKGWSVENLKQLPSHTPRF